MTFLAGARVVELSDDVGAAFCGQHLSLLGAEVVRLIDSERWLATRDESALAGVAISAAEVSLDRLKTRRALNGDTEAKRAAVAEALQGADVLITDQSAQELRELGVHWDQTAQNERLIHVHVSAFGAAGPYADWAGGDFEAQAFGGVTAQIGFPGRAPVPLPYKAGLLHAGLQAAGATTAALYVQKTTGRGAFIDISAAQALAVDVRNYSLLSRYYRLPLRRSGHRPPGSLGRYPCAIFPCKDGYVTMIVRDSKQYQYFLEMLGNPSWAEDPRYQDPLKNATIYADELDALVIPWLMQHTRDELVAKGLEYHFPVGALHTVDEVLKNTQYRWREFFDTVELEGKTFVLPGYPARR
jgi:crotonobetainyl-CoA:carnitine CoA-transferase CaiB-like acyl-CoA transferase